MGLTVSGYVGKREGGRWGTSHAGVARNAILGSQWRVGSVGCVILEWCQLCLTPCARWSGKVRTEVGDIVT